MILRDIDTVPVQRESLMTMDIDDCRHLLARAQVAPVRGDLAAHREMYWGQLVDALSVLLQLSMQQKQEIRELQSSVRIAADDAIRSPDA